MARAWLKPRDLSKHETSVYFPGNLEGSVEAFNVTDRRNDVTRIGNFGAAAYPASPSATFNQVTAVADPRTFQFAVRMSF